MARWVLAADVALLADLGTQIVAARGGAGRPGSVQPVCDADLGPRWGVVPVANYAAALGDPVRWPGPRQIYRAAGLSTMQYESAGKRRDGTVSREGSVALRHALIDLWIGLWHADPAAKAYAAAQKSRGKHGGIIACALAHRTTQC